MSGLATGTASRSLLGHPGCAVVGHETHRYVRSCRQLTPSLEKAVNALRIFPVDWIVGVLPEDDLMFAHDGTRLRPLGGRSRPSGLRLEREYL